MSNYDKQDMEAPQFLEALNIAGVSIKEWKEAEKLLTLRFPLDSGLRLDSAIYILFAKLLKESQGN